MQANIQFVHNKPVQNTNHQISFFVIFHSGKNKYNVLCLNQFTTLECTNITSSPHRQNNIPIFNAIYFSSIYFHTISESRYSPNDINNSASNPMSNALINDESAVSPWIIPVMVAAVSPGKCICCPEIDCPTTYIPKLIDVLTKTCAACRIINREPLMNLLQVDHSSAIPMTLRFSQEEKSYSLLSIS